METGIFDKRFAGAVLVSRTIFDKPLIMRRADCGCLIEAKSVENGSPMAIKFPQVGDLAQLIIELDSSCHKHKLGDLVDNQGDVILRHPED